MGEWALDFSHKLAYPPWPGLTFPTTKPQCATVEPLRTFESRMGVVYIALPYIIFLGQQ